MRPLDHGDLIWAARAIVDVDPKDPRVFCAQLFTSAAQADAHRRRTGKSHPVWGNGSLMAVSAAFIKRAEPDFQDIAYIDAWQLVLSHWRVCLASQTRN